ncbi:hypothetical protein HDU93_003534 [Gonapodya sp. JEL0774]|nr:hypothetical protein HDU93_003534 [Gonapodya sp. JEL0774]
MTLKLAVFAAVALGLVLPPWVTASPISTPETLDAASASKFFDEFFADPTWGVAGAAVAVADARGPVLVKGYGIANAETGAKVNPDSTLFQLGQVTKTFTAAAVLHALHSKHILRLEEDVDISLQGSTRILRGAPRRQEGYPDEVLNFAHLLTEASGIEEKVTGSMSWKSEDALNLTHTLQIFPRRVKSPNVVYMPSDHTYALLGQLVENAASTPFASYVRKNLLEPLSMTQTTVAPHDPTDPLHNRLADLAFPHTRDATGKFSKSRLAWPTVYPASGAWSTAKDMAAWLGFHLSHGSGIIPKDLHARMVKTAVKNNPKLRAGATMGFSSFELENGVKVFTRLGTVEGSQGFLALVPERDFGVWVGMNSGSESVKNALLRRFLARFVLPTIGTQVPAPKASPEFDPAPFVGLYNILPRSQNSYEEIFKLDCQARVSDSGKGTLIVTGNKDVLGKVGKLELVPIEGSPDVFRVVPEVWGEEAKDFFLRGDPIAAIVTIEIENSAPLQHIAFDFEGNPGHIYEQARYWYEDWTNVVIPLTLFITPFSTILAVIWVYEVILWIPTIPTYPQKARDWWYGTDEDEAASNKKTDGDKKKDDDGSEEEVEEVKGADGQVIRRRRKTRKDKQADERKAQKAKEEEEAAKAAKAAAKRKAAEEPPMVDPIDGENLPNYAKHASVAHALVFLPLCYLYAAGGLRYFALEVGQPMNPFSHRLLLVAPTLAQLMNIPFGVSIFMGVAYWAEQKSKTPSGQWWKQGFMIALFGLYAVLGFVLMVIESYW